MTTVRYKYYDKGWYMYLWQVMTTVRILYIMTKSGTCIYASFGHYTGRKDIKSEVVSAFIKSNRKNNSCYYDKLWRLIETNIVTKEFICICCKLGLLSEINIMTKSGTCIYDKLWPLTEKVIMRKNS